MPAPGDLQLSSRTACGEHLVGLYLVVDCAESSRGDCRLKCGCPDLGEFSKRRYPPQPCSCVEIAIDERWAREFRTCAAGFGAQKEDLESIPDSTDLKPCGEVRLAETGRPEQFDVLAGLDRPYRSQAVRPDSVLQTVLEGRTRMLNAFVVDRSHSFGSVRPWRFGPSVSRGGDRAGEHSLIVTGAATSRVCGAKPYVGRMVR